MSPEGNLEEISCQRLNLSTNDLHNGCVDLFSYCFTKMHYSGLQVIPHRQASDGRDHRFTIEAHNAIVHFQKYNNICHGH